jgi:hypothetical protein
MAGREDRVDGAGAVGAEARVELVLQTEAAG